MIHLPSGGDFRITADRKTPVSTKVKKILLNGQPLKAQALRHTDLTSPGSLHFIFE